MKLHPFQQLSVRSVDQTKLSPKYFGSYLVLEMVGSVAYRLDFPLGSLIHPTFHVSILKKAHGVTHTITPLPFVDNNSGLLYMSESILERKLVKRVNKAVVKVLVRWRGRALPEPT